MTPEWIVVVEATADDANPSLDQATLLRLIEQVADADPIALYSADRYAVQLAVSAGNPTDALQIALHRWSAAVRALGAPAWGVVRADVMTIDEFTAELRVGQQQDDLASEVRWHVLLEGSRGLMITLSANGTIVFTMPPLDPSVLLSPNKAINLADIVHPDDAALVRDTIDNLVNGGGDIVSFEARLRRDDGWRIYEATARNLLREPMVRAIVVNGEDVTDRRELEDRLAFQARHDELTGLANRLAFVEEIDRALAGAGTGDTLVNAAVNGAGYGGEDHRAAVFCIDVVDYDAVAEVAGQHVAGRVLVTLAERLQTGVLDGAIAARVGTDELALLCHKVAGREQAAGIAKQLADVLAKPVNIDGEQVSVTVNIGVALGSSQPQRASTLLRHAEVAVHRARHGRARYEIFRKRQPAASEPDVSTIPPG